MRTHVWISGWQQQCCGDGFAVGSEVSWEVVTGTVAEELLGPDLAGEVGYREEHHGGPVDGLLTGTVRAVHVVTTRRVPAPGRVLEPVPGSARTRSVPECDPWEPERRAGSEGRRFEGWVVRLEPATYLAGGRQPAPPRQRGRKRRRT